jgi:hypothetical protein
VRGRRGFDRLNAAGFFPSSPANIVSGALEKKRQGNGMIALFVHNFATNELLKL